MDKGLLSQIQKGSKLKKAITNDRSAPVIDGKATTSAAPTLGRPPVPSGNSSGSGLGTGVPTGAPGIGGLFANGVPQLRSANGPATPKPPVIPGRAVPKPPTAPATVSRASNFAANSDPPPPPLPGRSPAATLPRVQNGMPPPPPPPPPPGNSHSTGSVPTRAVPMPPSNSTVNETTLHTSPSAPPASNRGAAPPLPRRGPAPPPPATPPKPRLAAPPPPSGRPQTPTKPSSAPPPPPREKSPSPPSPSLNARAPPPPVRSSPLPPPPPPPNRGGRPALPSSSAPPGRAVSTIIMPNEIAAPPLPNRTNRASFSGGDRPSVAAVTPKHFSAYPAPAQVHPEPPTTEGRWTFHTSSDFPPPKNFDRGLKRYASGSSSGSSIQLDLSRFR